MKIAPINLSYSQKLSLKGGNEKTTSPFVVESPKTYDKGSYEFEKEYMAKVLEALNERKDELYSYLDSMIDDDGATVVDKIANMFDMDSIKDEEYSFLHKTSSENVENMEKNGFDPEKISITEYGPGFYVGFGEGQLSIYSGDKLRVKYEGNTAQGKDLSKSNEIRSDVVNKLREYLNLKMDVSNPLIWKELESFSKFANEYIRRTITEKLGIDGAFANESDGYFVIFNPDAAKEIKRSDF